MSPNIVHERPSFKDDVEQGWQASYNALKPYREIDGGDFTEESANQYLIQYPHSEVENPMVLWLQRDSIFLFNETMKAAKTALSVDVKNKGQWSTLFKSICASPDKDLLSYHFISNFGNVLQELDPSLELYQLFSKNRDIVEGSQHIVQLYSFLDSQWPKYITRYYSDVDKAENLLGLDEETADSLRRVVAGRLLDSFLSHKLYTDRGHCIGNAIDVDRGNYYDWILDIKEAIDILSRGDEEQLIYFRGLITKTLIDQFGPEFVDTQTGNYDGIFRMALIAMLNGLGMDDNAKGEVYKQLPGFLRLPGVEETIHYSYMPYIENEFRKYGIHRNLDTGGKFISSHFDLVEKGMSVMSVKELKELGAKFYTAKALKKLGIDLNDLELQLRYNCDSVRLLCQREYERVFVQKDNDGITKIAIIPKTV